MATVTFSDGRSRSLDTLEVLTVRLYRGEHGIEPYCTDVHPEWCSAIKRYCAETGQTFAEVSATLWSWAMAFDNRVVL